MSQGRGDERRGSPFDRRMLREIRTVGGERLLQEVMELFVERTPGRLQAASRACAGGDLEGAAKALHSLRSGAGTVGALRLAELAGRLERRARRGELPAAELERLRGDTEETVAAARRLCAAGGRASRSGAG